MGLHAVGGAEVVRALIVPNLKEYEGLIKDEIQGEGSRKAEAEKVLSSILRVLASLVDENVPMMNGHTDEAADEMRERLIERIGELAGNRIMESSHIHLAKAILG